ncbi:MAG: RNase adapter RapZ [Zymomonas mobilis subsp. pomaceae]|uniref:RNase adapter RapZ n=1 Tax=Zymomonas mobilis TaxID=542 RepID=UPI0039EB21AE
MAQNNSSEIIPPLDASSAPPPKRIILVSGLSGAGKSTTLRTFEDMGWETVDNLPLSLLERLILTPPSSASSVTPYEGRPLALGIDSRTRGFDAKAFLKDIVQLRKHHAQPIDILFLDCSDSELMRRFDTTRRRHPLALDRPMEDGIAQEREFLAPLREAAEFLIDTTTTSSHSLQLEIRQRFGAKNSLAPNVSILSFGFSRGIPRNCDLLFDMRFLQNPYWDKKLRSLTGLDAEVAQYIEQDPACAPALSKIEDLLLFLLPRYITTGKSYIIIAFACTGGRHRSVYAAEWMAAKLRQAHFSLTITHRDLKLPLLESQPEAFRGGKEYQGG